MFAAVDIWGTPERNLLTAYTVADVPKSDFDNVMFFCQDAADTVGDEFPRVVTVSAFDCASNWRAIVKALFQNIDTPADTFWTKFACSDHGHVGTID